VSRDALWLIGIECRCRVGVPKAERARRQKILIDVGLEVDARAAAERDDFREAADYWAVEKAVRAQAEAGELALIETLAERAAAAALKAAPAARAATIRVHKTPSVMPKTREVHVVIRRER
jgi:dihydroneopterin aldolase